MLFRTKAGGYAAGLLFFIFACSGCTCFHQTPSLWESAGQEDVYITGVPFYPQEKYQCGPASLAMLLGWSGLPVQPEDLTGEVYSPNLHGSLQPSLVSAARNHGRLAYPLANPEDLFAELEAGNPVMVLQNLGLSWFPVWHYAVVVGYEKSGKDIILHSGKTAAEYLSWRTFRNTWQRSDYWGLLVLPAGKMPASAKEQPYLAAVSGLERAGRLEPALQWYRLGLEKWPRSLAAMMGIGNCQYGMGRFNEAEASFRKAASLHPDNGIPFNNLAQTLLMQGEKAKAREAASKAVALGGPLKETFEETLREIERSVK